MSAVQTNFITIACDGPNCKTPSVTFVATKEEQAKANQENPWLGTTQRVVGRGDGQQFTYCSDQCEAEALAAGTHNVPEPTRIVMGNAQQAQLAAQAQQRAALATAALKAGQPVNIT